MSCLLLITRGPRAPDQSGASIPITSSPLFSPVAEISMHVLCTMLTYSYNVLMHMHVCMCA